MHMDGPIILQMTAHDVILLYCSFQYHAIKKHVKQVARKYCITDMTNFNKIYKWDVFWLFIFL